MAPLNRIFEAPEFFDFFHACRRYETGNIQHPRIGDSAAKREDYLRFGQDPFLAFPDSNISRARHHTSGQVELFVRFLGLLGPQGAMPLALTDEAHFYARNHDDALARFADLFNRRFIQLFFRAWADSRAVVQRDRRYDDKFERYVGSHIGIGSPALRDLDSVPDAAKTAFAGLMAPRVKSVTRLRDVIAGLFGVKVRIEEFVGVRLLFEPSQRSRIGVGFASLGESILLGAGVYSVQDKFRLQLVTRTLAEYQELLPSGKKARKLAELVFFYVGMELEWDVELALPVGEAVPVRLGQSGQLGWTTWMAPNWSASQGEMRTDARFDLSKRFGLS